VRDLPAIEATYTQLASILDLKLDAARQASDEPAVLRIERHVRINDAAYFILCWGQLESRLNDVCEQAVRRRRQSSDWEVRRAWDAHDPDRPRAKFEDRAALVLDREGPAYREMIKWYGERNRLAHGRSLATALDIPSIIAAFYRISAEMRT
jgi:hypothetical protein